MTSAKSSILYICQNALGDVITTLPSIQYLRQTYPQATLDICINRTLADIFAANPNVDRVIPAPPDWFSADPAMDRHVQVERLPGFRSAYGAVIDSVTTPQTGCLITLLKPSQAIGIGFSDVLHVYNLPLPLHEWRRWGDGHKNVVECFGDLSRMLAGDFKWSAPVLHVAKAAQELGLRWIESHGASHHSVIAFIPGAGHPKKRWPMHHFIEVARTLKNQGCRPLFVFGPKEADLYTAHQNEILTMGGLVYHCEHTRIQLLAGILRQCVLLVSNDCGVMHVGASVGCRVLAIFGPSISRIWFPYSRTRNRVIERNVDCRLGCKETCAERTCLATILPEEVASHATKLLRSEPLVPALQETACYKTFPPE